MARRFSGDELAESNSPSADRPDNSLKTTLKAEINEEAWESLHRDISRPFAKPASGRIAVKVINPLAMR
jgi:adenine-specific DNA-methyltransferase